jgi:hypothetical protein
LNALEEIDPVPLLSMSLVNAAITLTAQITCMTNIKQRLTSVAVTYFFTWGGMLKSPAQQQLHVMTEAITIVAMRAMNEIIGTRKVKTNAIMRRENMAIPRGLPASGLEQ